MAFKISWLLYCFIALAPPLDFDFFAPPLDFDFFVPPLDFDFFEAAFETATALALMASLDLVTVFVPDVVFPGISTPIGCVCGCVRLP